MYFATVLLDFIFDVNKTVSCLTIFFWLDWHHFIFGTYLV